MGNPDWLSARADTDAVGLHDVAHTCTMHDSTCTCSY
jgi:hypothetical protein